MFPNEAPKMAEETWHGIPRSKIQWYPTIDPEKCTSCTKCINYCHKGVFAIEEKDGKKKTVVKNLNGCVVTCTGCDSICPTSAISHPSEKEFKNRIKALRKNPDFRLGERISKKGPIS